MKNKSSLIEIINTYFQSPYKELLIDEIKPSIRLKSKSNSQISIGESKFGGCPHLKNDKKWPKKDGTYLNFLCQINLSEVSSFDLDNQLPKKGILYFFCDLDSWSSPHVIYEKEIDSLNEIVPPLEISKEKKTFFHKLFN